MRRCGLGHPITLIGLVAVVGLVALIVAACNCWAGETSGSFGYGGLYVWQDGNTFQGSGVPLGITYTPDRAEIVITKAGVVEQISPSPLFFSATQVIRDGLPDFTFTGMGYQVYDWLEAGVKIYVEANVAVKMIEADTYKLGGYGGVRIPFAVSTQAFRCQVGAGWCDDPMLMFSINWATQ